MPITCGKGAKKCSSYRTAQLCADTVCANRGVFTSPEVDGTTASPTLGATAGESGAALTVNGAATLTKLSVGSVDVGDDLVVTGAATFASMEVADVKVADLVVTNGVNIVSDSLTISGGNVIAENDIVVTGKLRIPSSPTTSNPQPVTQFIAGSTTPNTVWSTDAGSNWTAGVVRCFIPAGSSTTWASLSGFFPVPSSILLPGEGAKALPVISLRDSNVNNNPIRAGSIVNNFTVGGTVGLYLYVEFKVPAGSTWSTPAGGLNISGTYIITYTK